MKLPRTFFFFLRRHLSYFPFAIDEMGVWLYYYGDEVCWTWPWSRRGLPKYISLEFSGTGEFGDVRFGSLKELHQEWEDYGKSFP